VARPGLPVTRREKHSSAGRCRRSRPSRSSTADRYEPESDRRRPRERGCAPEKCQEEICTAANGNDSRPIVAPTKSTEKRACKGYAAALARSFGSMFTDLRHGTESYPAPEPGTGAGLSGAPPTETGPTGLRSGETIFRDARTTRARVLECEMLEVVNGVTALCRASACAASEES